MTTPTTRARPRAWSIAIPGFQPTSLNRLLGHPMARHRLKSRDAATIDRACLLAGVPRARISRREREDRKTLNVPAWVEGDPVPRRRHVRLEITLAKGQRAPDSDNVWKALLDVLVSAGMLFDDSRQWCSHDAEPVYVRGVDEHDKGTTIYLEDV
jgi:hypothetical protein